ncbi:MAG: ribosome small subunit-dependent GTPase A [Candidatus Omnitrophica bacterium]|nr:ribosome small subunit-dependent GTPase A [Candidatus Omnitrophota bacterium]MBU1047461.1 ribosome small subunit-dependent GTPase A [Candidatus Omnitrophota bacterium]MBU1766870.1 ribosome small subunit-dependent GTPase A [Candidatus Omnitrophota bacterium]MBU1888824.1 ribosome small subunit-dependent GTPase A [Candidatus Omnitrophota bacterium]
MKLKDLGYRAFFESNRKLLGLGAYSVARVIAGHKEAYIVKNTTNEYLAKITGRQMFNASSRADYPAVGDWVSITEPDYERAVICGILPRKTMLKRKYSNETKTQVIAANIDVTFAVESVDRDYNLNRLERCLAIAKDGNIKPAIVLNKIDLIPPAELNIKITQINNRFKSIVVIPTSTIADKGLDKLTSYIKKGKTYCFLGSSGVGKSSLINKLLGTDNIKTNTISEHTGRGKHTTSGRGMYFLKNGGIVIDNPGMREIGMVDSKLGLKNVFNEISALAKKCGFSDCTHISEPGCAVLDAIKYNKLDENKYSNYLKLKKEVDYYQMTKLEKRRKDRKFGKFVKTALEQLKKYKI